MDLFGQLQGLLGSGMLQQIGGQVGAENPEQVQTASTDIITSMIGALSKNASSETGAESLNQALEQDHDGSILNNVMGLFTGGGQNPMNNQQPGVNQNTTNGAGILKHLFGGQQQQVAQQVSQNSGMDMNSVMTMMTTYAPIVMGFLGKAKQQNNMNPAQLQQYLAQQKETTKQQNPQAGGMLGFLDQDGDGDIMDDIGGMLNKLF